MTNIIERQIEIDRFLNQYFQGLAYRTEVVTADASFRRYFRVFQQEQSYILMDSVPDKVDNQPFVELNHSFTQAGLFLPRILKKEMHSGLLLLEDLGSVHLADHLNCTGRTQYYKEVINLLPDIANVENSAWMKAYDSDFITKELEIFEEWLLTDWLQYELSQFHKRQWHMLKQTLVECMLTQPQVTMHRDFHSRNIMQHKGRWALIDYQDAVQGPVTYDAVSLLRDCYFKLPDEEFGALQSYSYDKLKHAGCLGNMRFSDYQYNFDLTGLQRHLKAAGIFVRLWLRDGKAGYLKNIIPTLNYVIDVAKCYESFQWLATWLLHEIMPLIKRKLNQKI